MAVNRHGPLTRDRRSNLTMWVGHNCLIEFKFVKAGSWSTFGARAPPKPVHSGCRYTSTPQAGCVAQEMERHRSGYHCAPV